MLACQLQRCDKIDGRGRQLIRCEWIDNKRLDENEYRARASAVGG